MLKTVSSITNAIGALNYKGTWNASTNTPTLASGVGVKGDYYVVSVAGTTALDGISNWGVGDWVTYNGSVWQRVEGGADLNGVNLSVSGVATFAAGALATPSLTTSGDLNTGIYFPAADEVAIAVGGVEGLRVNSVGNLLSGVTSSASKMVLQGAPATDTYFAQYINTKLTDLFGLRVRYSAASPNSGSNQFLDLEDSAGLRLRVKSNGGIDNFSANDSNLSDRREKTNFAPAKSYLDIICAIPVQTFNYIDQNMEDDPGLTLGVVAQDVQAVAPELVKEGNWGTEEEPKMRLSIYQTDLQYALMKCIQEQQAIISTLTARVAALESK